MICIYLHIRVDYIHISASVMCIICFDFTRLGVYSLLCLLKKEGTADGSYFPVSMLFN